MLNFFFFSIIFFIIFLSILLLFINNPINAVLFLIIIFFNLSVLLFLFGFDFLGLLFLMIYIGAIAIFFLFILMLVNIPIYTKKKTLIKPLFFTIFLFSFYLSIEELIKENFFFFFSNTILFDQINFNSVNTINVYGSFLYVTNWIYFILLAVILLVAMLSSMIIVRKLKILKN